MGGDETPGRSGQTFPKVARIRKRRDFLAAQDRGKRWPARHFLVVQTSSAGVARLGITVTKKIGGAVERNHIKRRVREAFRRRWGALRDGVSLVVIARDGAAELDAAAISAELTPIFDRFAGGGALAGTGGASGGDSA